MKLTTVITPEEDMFVALCPELDVVSQGYTRDEARANLKEALELLFEVADREEIDRRLSENAGMVSTLEIERIAA